MKEKSLNLIETIVVEHKKYHLYESIKDEIINYVFNNAEAVINNVNNEDVLKLYINKLVSTAMVVVPKKLNVKVERKTETLALQDLVKSPKKTDLPKDTLIVDIKMDEQLNEKSEEVDFVKEASLEEDVNNGESFEELVFSDDNESSRQDDSFEQNIKAYNEEGVIDQQLSADAILLGDDLNENLETEVIDEPQNFELEVDQTLVVNMINGVNQNKTEELEYLDEEKSIDEEDLSNYENLEDLEIVEANLDFSEDSSEENQEDFNLDIKNQSDFTLEENYENPEDEFLMADNNEDSFKESFEEKSIDFQTEQEIINLEDEYENDSEEVSDVMIDDSVEMLECFDEENDLNLLNAEEDVIIESEELEPNPIDDNILAEETFTEDNINNDDYNSYDNCSLNYECFNYEPTDVVFDSQDICDKLSVINDKYSELNILKVCEYKFYRKMSISDIAESLNLEVEAVLEALNLIVDSIKD